MGREVRTVLVVDNSATMLFYLGMLLKRLEYNVTAARSGEEALEKAGEALPAIVLASANLPKMSGMQLLKALKDNPRTKAVPAVILSPDNDPGMQDTFMRMGCAAVLNKPVEPEDLYRTLQAVSEATPRRNIRLATSLKVVVGDGTAGGSERTEYATAISEGGLFIRTLYPQQRNALMPLRLFLPGREVHARAAVLYSYGTGEGPYKEPGMGVKFVELADPDRDAIRAFIKEQITRDISAG